MNIEIFYDECIALIDGENELPCELIHVELDVIPTDGNIQNATPATFKYLKAIGGTDEINKYLYDNMELV